MCLTNSTAAFLENLEEIREVVGTVLERKHPCDSEQRLSEVNLKETLKKSSKTSEKVLTVSDGIPPIILVNVTRRGRPTRAGKKDPFQRNWFPRSQKSKGN